MKTVHLILFGLGNVGSTLLNQVIKLQEQLKREAKIDLRIPIITNSNLVFYREEGISSSWECDFDAFSVPYKIDEIISFVHEKSFDNVIAVDATASAKFIDHYITFIQNGFHIVAANKNANAANYSFYKDLRNQLEIYNREFEYETNVGAGLPVIQTVRDLIASGDQITKIKGVFSGSVSYMFNEFSLTNNAFSNGVKKAVKLGLTEPDVRDDLSGKDVAKKLLILARELNLEKEISDVEVDSLVPTKLNGKTSVDYFNKNIKLLDLKLSNYQQKLKSEEVLRYVGELNLVENKMKVAVKNEVSNSPLGQLKDSDNLFEIFTETYGDKPIIIQGSGAGAAVTARGVLADILKITNRLN